MKKLLALLMATLMLFSLVACRDSNETDVTAPGEEEIIVDDSLENDVEAPEEDFEAETEDEAVDTPAEKPDSTPAVKPENKPAEKPENTPAAKPEQTPEVKPEVKPEEKPEETPEAKPEAGNTTTGATMLSIFRANKDKTPEAIANACLADKSIQFMSMTTPMEEGFFMEFDGDVKGFDSCVKFGPAMGSIAFSGFVFEVSGDANAFANELKSRANPRWNICVEADETVCEVYGNKVFFLMCPSSLEG